jgi:hypothetical protein
LLQNEPNCETYLLQNKEAVNVHCSQERVRPLSSIANLRTSFVLTAFIADVNMLLQSFSYYGQAYHSAEYKKLTYFYLYFFECSLYRKHVSVEATDGNNIYVMSLSWLIYCMTKLF